MVFNHELYLEEKLFLVKVCGNILTCTVSFCVPEAAVPEFLGRHISHSGVTAA